MIEFGTKEGQRCNRYNCEGIMELIIPAEGCYCFTSPPCSLCVDSRPICDMCGHEVYD